MGADCLLGNLVSAGGLPFNWKDKVMEDVGWKVGRMLDEEAGRDTEKEEVDEPNFFFEGLRKKYPWFLQGH
jgi:hypothetical protein